MKVFSRLFVTVAALTLAACGAEGERPDVEAHSLGMKAFLPEAQPLPKGVSDYEQPDPEQGAPDEVRETGFAPDPEDFEEVPDEVPCIDCVRETGFVPAPTLQLVDLVGDIARLEWTVDDSVDRVRIDATRYGSDGHPVASDVYFIEGYTHFDLPRDNRRTIATATAVDDGGKIRSKQSNPVDIPLH